jgi:hypothetical protein
MGQSLVCLGCTSRRWWLFQHSKGKYVVWTLAHTMKRNYSMQVVLFTIWSNTIKTCLLHVKMDSLSHSIFVFCDALLYIISNRIPSKAFI